MTTSDDVDPDAGPATNIEPASEEAKNIKQIFDEAAGPEYIRYAYEPVYRLPRRLFYFSRHGINSEGHMKEREEIPVRWEDRKQSRFT